jgi:AraC-like DNA-binding protein
MLELQSIYYDEITDPHWEKPLSAAEFHILILILQGQVMYTLNGQAVPMSKGSLMFVRAGTMRHGAPIQGPHQKISAHFLWPDGSEPEFAFLQQLDYFHTQTRQFEYVKQRFSLLAQRWIAKLPYYQIICRTVATELLATACREYEERQYPSRKLAHVQVLQQYILDHYTEPLRIDELAALVERTPNYITSIFREITGCTPIEYLHQIRVSAARDLLLNSRLSISEIAERLGYCDAPYFNRVYKRVVGSPPSALLKLKNARPL